MFDRLWRLSVLITHLGGANFANLDIDNFLPAANYYFESFFTAAPTSNGGSFLNEFYDDEGWNWTYLEAAEEIFTDTQAGERATCGVHWWKKDRKNNTAIANELYLSVAALLAVRLPDQRRLYGDIAIKQHDLFIESGLIRPNDTITDSINLETCQPQGIAWSYNQGVILGALIDMNRLTSGQSYLETAIRIAKGTIAHMTDSNGILVDDDRPGPLDSGAARFKGVFARNLGYL